MSVPAVPWLSFGSAKHYHYDENMSGILMETIHTRQVNGRFKLIALITHVSFSLSLRLSSSVVPLSVHSLSPFHFISFIIRVHRIFFQDRKQKKRSFAGASIAAVTPDKSSSCSCSASHVSFFIVHLRKYVRRGSFSS